MSFERMEVASAACPCGKGRVRIDVTYNDTDWGIRDEDWEAEFTCSACRVDYNVVRSGRGVDVIRAEDFRRRNDLVEQAASEVSSALRSEVVASTLVTFAAIVEDLPTVVARYRLLHQLKIETATLATFRKHIRGSSVEKWLTWMVPLERDEGRSLRHLIAIFDFLSIDSSVLKNALDRADTLKAQAITAHQNVVMSLGPVSLFAAFGRGAV